MKKIIAIFSVILTFGLGVFNEVMANINGCPTGSGGTGDDWLNVGSTHIDCDGGDCSNKRFTTIGAIFKDEQLQTPKMWHCRIGSTWEQDYWVNDGNVPNCSGPNYPTSATNAHKALYKKSDNTVVFNGDFDTAEQYFIGRDYCVGYECDTDFDLIGGECIRAADREQVCTDSHGQWNDSKCLCGSDRTDGKGGGQTYDVPDQKCKCSNPSQEWDEAEGKCVDPDAADVAACNDSGGNWVDGECKCNETTKTQSPDKKTCVRNNAYYNCTASTSGGNWVSGRCQCDSDKGLTGPNSTGACYCSNPAQVYDSRRWGRCTDSAETVCKNTGGVWNGTNCDCDVSGKNIKKKDDSNPVQCECISEDYEWKSDNTQGCKLSDEAQRRKDSFEQLKQDCLKWTGSTWEPSTWESPTGSDISKWKCNCPGSGVTQASDVACQCDARDGYTETAPNKCERIGCAELQARCNTATGTEYKDYGAGHCECKCKDENKAYVYSSNSCVDRDNPAKIRCNAISGAVIGKGGVCVCLSTGRSVPPNGKCPSGTTSGGASASTAVTVPDTRQKEDNIRGLYTELTSISDGFGKSHWKTASGNFNGARLASDSVAGVVLGTVGGVVTSNVIKKNQIKGGFESLQCTIGGQLVADFGDQFQVGIR